MMFVHGKAVLFSRCVAVVLLLTTQGRGCDADDQRDKRSDDLGAVQAVLETQAQKLSMLDAELQSTKAELQSTKAAQQSTNLELQSTKARLESARASLGSSFVRWGRSTCPVLNGTRLLYSGYAGATNAYRTGGGANRLCLTKEPVFDDTPGHPYDSLNGMQYNIPGHSFTDVPCAVCHALQSVTYMVPGTNRCPAGSVQQYHGWLTAGNPSDTSSTEFLCLDGAPEDLPGTQQHRSESGYILQVKTECGTLPCPPYTEAKIVLCVVCSV